MNLEKEPVEGNLQKESAGGESAEGVCRMESARRNVQKESVEGNQQRESNVQKESVEGNLQRE